MTRNKSGLLAAALVLGFLFSSNAAEFHISGNVVDQDGTPVAGAIVNARTRDGQNTISVISDETGSFAIPSQIDREVTAWKKGYRRSEPQTATRENASKVGIKLVSVPVVPVSELTSSDILPYLPEDPNRQAFIIGCSACHGYSTVIAHPRSRDEWLQTVTRMQSILYDSGFKGNPREREEIVDYLSKYLGEGSTLAAEIGKKVKETYKPALPIGHDIVFSAYEIPSPVALSHTSVPDKSGHVWFTENKARKIGRLDVKTGEIKEYPIETPGVGPHGITVGPDGTVWFTAISSVIGRIDPVTDKKEEYRVPFGKAGNETGPHTIIVAKSGKILFNELINHSISSFDPTTKEFKRFNLGPDESAYGILEGDPDIIWFCLVQPGQIGYLNAKTGEIKSYQIPTKNSGPQRFRFDKQGRIWFGEFRAGKIGMFDPATKEFAEYDLPYRRSPYCVYIDGEGNIWAAAYDRDSLVKFNPITKQMTEYPLPSVSVIVRDIWPDETGKMWFSQWFQNKVTSLAINER